MSISSLILRSRQVAKILRKVVAYNDGIAIKSETTVASDVACLIQIRRQSLNQLALGEVITKGYRGYFLAGVKDTIQEGDLVEVTYSDGTIHRFKVLEGLNTRAVTPRELYVACNLEWDPQFSPSES